MMPVQREIRSLPMPMLLYICPATSSTTQSGSPSAKYSVGTHRIGERAGEASMVMRVSATS
jgi:hypothetical protein